MELQQTTTTTTQVWSYRDGAMTIKRMKEMAEEQHHRNVGLQAANCQLSSQLKQAQDQIAQLRNAFQTERLAYADMKSKQTQLDKHIEDFNGILEDIDVTHLKLTTSMNKCHTQQEDLVSKLEESCKHTTSIDAMQKKNLESYSKLELRVIAMDHKASAAQDVNKGISDELVKCKTMISEKEAQLETCQSQLDSARANQVKLESSLSAIQGKYDNDMKQKDLDQAVLKQELSRTVNSLNDYLEQRRVEQEKKLQAEKHLQCERERSLRQENATRQGVKDFVVCMSKKQEVLESNVKERVNKWDKTLQSFRERLMKVSKSVEKKCNQLKLQQQALKSDRDIIRGLKTERDELTEKVRSLNSKLESTSTDLMSKTAEADIAAKERKEMQKQLKCLKEEQKQYCIALSNQNASELNKMKQKMKEEVEDVKEKLQNQLEEKQKACSTLDEENKTLQESLDQARKHLEEMKVSTENQMKKDRSAHQKELRDQTLKFQKDIQNLETDLSKARRESGDLRNQLNAALAESSRRRAEVDLAPSGNEFQEDLDRPSEAVTIPAPRGKVKRKPRPSKNNIGEKQAPQKKQIKGTAKTKNKTQASRALAKKGPKKLAKPKQSDFDDLFEDSLLDPYSF